MKINPVNSRLGRLVRRNPSLPRVLALVLLVVATAVWASGALHWSAKPPARLVPTTKVNTPPPPPQPQPHFWESYLGPGRLRGSEERNRTQIGIEKASLVMLVRNNELKTALMAMKDIEDRFNRHYRYPWTFLNNENFTTDFIEQTTRMASGRVTHGLIPAEHWSVPSFIDDARFRENMERLGKRRVIYGDVESYHHMCRYNSGFFWRAAQLAEYDWYWRVEPGTNFFCDQLYDPFTFMRENGKRYSFVIAMYEFRLTIETLWDSTREFARLRPGLVAKENTLGFLVDDLVPGEGSAFDKDYNLCHFWSNFEIGDLNLWRSEAYREYFDFLDRKGGFFYERWGDAPVHSIAAALFLSKDQIHFWSDIGYRHPPYERCPQDDGGIDTARCICPFAKEESFDFDGYSCQKRWWRLNGQDEKGRSIPNFKIPDY